MEESENRKLRLKAMRMEAADVEASPSTDSTSFPAHLSNPLAEPSGSSLAQDPPSATRFDFYTDPMAAYSGNRRKTQRTDQNSPSCFSTPISSASPGPGNSNMNMNMNMSPSPSPQYTNPSHSGDQRMYRAPSPYHNPAPWRSPIRSPSPYPQQVGTPPWTRPDFTAGFVSPGFVRAGSPSPIPSPGPNNGRGSGYQFNNSPTNFRPGGSPSYNNGRGNRPQFNNSSSPGFGFRGSPSPSPGVGRGRGRGGRGGGGVTARERPDMFFNRSMLEDPWRMLKPVVREIPAEDAWIPKSIRNLGGKRSGGGGGGGWSSSKGSSGSGLSLAESLAASYEEAAALAAAYEESTAA